MLRAPPCDRATAACDKQAPRDCFSLTDNVFVAGFSFNLLALLFCAHYLLPKSQSYTAKFVRLQYYNAKSGKYGAGFDDSYFVAFVVVLLTGLRAATMEYALAPFAKYMGISKKKEVTRFAEQAWLVLYCTTFWSLGFVCAPFALVQPDFLCTSSLQRHGIAY